VNTLTDAFGATRTGVGTIAHLAGLVFGLCVCLTLLGTGVLARNDFDLFFMIKQWKRRRDLRAATAVAGLGTADGPIAARVRADHSSTILHFMTMCEGLYALKFVLSAAAWYGGLRDGRASFHLLRDNCATSIAYGQLLGMAAIAYNACWMTDILVVLFLPLRNSATLIRRRATMSRGRERWCCSSVPSAGVTRTRRFAP
jgi:hypothetical protein